MSGQLLGAVSATPPQTSPKSAPGHQAATDTDREAFRQQLSAQQPAGQRAPQRQAQHDAAQPPPGDAPAAEADAAVIVADERSLAWARPAAPLRAADAEGVAEELPALAAVPTTALTDELRTASAEGLPTNAARLPASAGRELPRWQAALARSPAASSPTAENVTLAAQGDLQTEAATELKALGLGESKPELGLQFMPARPVFQLQTQAQAQAQDSPLAGMTRTLAEPALATERLLQAVQSSTATSSEAMPTLDASGGSERLAQSAAQRLMWMAGERISRAELALNPPDLGPVDIQMELEGDQLRLQMAAATGAAKELLDAALPRLRDQLAAAGLELVQAEVSYRQGGEAGSDGTPADRRAGNGADGTNAAEESSEPSRPLHSRRVSLLDQYA